jgi:hypothetical protein
MELLFGEDERVARFVARLIPECGRGFGECKAIGVVGRDKQGPILVAGLVYYNWSPEAGTIEISAAATTSRWMTKPVLRFMFGYPFEQIGCQMVVQRVSSKDERQMRMIRRFGGYNIYRIKRGRGRDEDEMVCTLTVEDWRNTKFMRKA